MKNLLISSALCAVLPLAALAGPSDNSLNWASDSMPSSIDFYQHTIREGIVLGHHIWDTLIYRNNATGEIEPHLAESFRWVDDTTLEFVLRQGITFHDGSPFNADDVVGTIDYVTQNTTTQSIFFLESAEKIDDYTVRIHTKGLFPAALEYLANIVPIYPSDYYAEVGVEGMSLHPIGTGPFRVTEVVPGERVSMERNPDYFGGVKGVPHLDSMEFRRIGEFNTQAIELMTGRLDWIWRVPPDAVQQFEGQSQLKVDSGSLLRTGFVLLDAAGRTGDTPLKDVRVRQALSHAINRDGIRAAMIGPGSELLNTACSPTQFGCEGNVVTYDYDPALARQMLADAGYPDGFSIDFYGYRDRPVVEAIIGDLNTVGVRANLTMLQASALSTMRLEGRIPMSFQAWGSNSIMDSGASLGFWFDGSGNDYARDPQVTAWIEEGGSVIDPDARTVAYSHAVEAIAENAYIIPMFTYALNYVYNKDLNFTPVPDETPRFFEASWGAN
ncbi:peptide/nickel transport system substrate-binding protein [Ketogulonicigenium robustum]|uniref:Peptide/nickel transport system substrate-binding protein n=1 Tax=Ketogulonicigenium robustum TaxID=92947 RepID=A0A1W6P1C5_9RHOB|nr:ABC transporter substrate-binding protein [Ketogulonicigenium robustum]ARO15306.1 peptide/nickel transport system substrate-binding protein [Ketogulonicigenium robustum]